METMKFSVACKNFFGFLPGQGIGDFLKEVKALTDQDRKDMIPGLEKNLGVKIEQ